MNVANAMKPDTAQGRKYGCSRKNRIRPKALGHWVAGLEKTPPIMGLRDGLSVSGLEKQLRRLRNC